MKNALPFFSVLIPYCICLYLALCTSVFKNVVVDLSHDHYAEAPIDSFPSIIKMPFNSLVNIGYAIMGFYWLCFEIKDSNISYFKGDRF
jgi:hypothetical protein